MKRKKLMIFPMNMAAHYLRCLELCKKLKKTYEIKIAYTPQHENLINELGFETFKVENFDPEEVKSAAARFDFSWINYAVIKHIFESQLHAIEEHQPDMVLGDASFTLKMAAQRTGTLFISLLNGYLTKYYRLTRKISRKHPGYQYSTKMPAQIFDLLTRLIENVSFKRIHQPFRRIRKELKLPRQYNFLDELEGDVNLICDLPEIFPQKRLPSNYLYIGPLFYQGDELEKEVLNFIEGINPTILVSMGSTGDWNHVTFLKDPLFRDYRIIVSGDEYSTLKGPNILSKSFINHTAILHKINIVICHGGNGTMYQALAYGVPLLCIPTNFEQEWNVQRIEDLGFGERINDLSDLNTIRAQINFLTEKRNTPLFIEIKNKIKMFSKSQIILEK